MATLTVRGLDDRTKRLLRVQAARHGRSMEAEARIILQKSLTPEPGPSGGNFGSRVHARFASLGGVDLLLPPRDDPPRGVVFDE